MKDIGSWLAYAVAAATIVNAGVIMFQVKVQRGQHRFEEGQAHRVQADEWASLKQDWVNCIMAATGPDRSGLLGIPASNRQKFRNAIDMYVKREIGELEQLTVPESLHEYSSDEDESALSRMREYFDSVDRVLLYLSRVSSLIVRNRISVAAVYDAIGHDLLRLGITDFRPLVSSHFGTDPCVAPAMYEREHWKTLEIHEIVARLGWGSSLSQSRGAAERIILLLQLLGAYAYRAGDTDSHFYSYPHYESPAVTICHPARLALCWRAARRFNVRRAIGLTLYLSRQGRKARRIHPEQYAPRVWQVSSAILPKSMILVESSRRSRICGVVSRIWLIINAPIFQVNDLLMARFKAKRVADLRRLEAPGTTIEFNEPTPQAGHQLNFWYVRGETVLRGEVQL